MNGTLNHRIIDRGLYVLAMYNMAPGKDLPIASYIYGSLQRALSYDRCGGTVGARIRLMQEGLRQIGAGLPHT